MLNLESFANLVQQMRDAQKRYFKTRSFEALQLAKDLESRVDEICAIIASPTIQEELGILGK